MCDLGIISETDFCDAFPSQDKISKVKGPFGCSSNLGDILLVFDLICGGVYTASYQNVGDHRTIAPLAWGKILTFENDGYPSSVE